MTVMRVTLLIAGLLVASQLRSQDPRASGSITVERLVLDVHVTDSRGKVIPDLVADDFEVRIGGSSAEIDTVEFIAFERNASTLPPRRLDSERRVEIGGESRGRMIVLFFQTDFARQRVKGQMRILHHLDRMIETIEPYDRVAVVQHDSHLRIRQDFTSDHAKLRRAIRESLSVGGGTTPESVPEPSLLEELDPDQMRNAATPERALLLLGNALSKFEGPKTMLMLGWGLGHFSRSGVRMDHLYTPARKALELSRTSVFVLDISDADYHSLEVALIKVAEDTGGFYVKTHLFPTMAMDRFTRTIEGRYEVVVKRPISVSAGRSHPVQVRVKQRGATALAPREIAVRR